MISSSLVQFLRSVISPHSSVGTLRQVFLYIPAPKAEHRPPVGFESGGNFLVTLHIPLDLRYPKLLVRLEIVLAFLPIIAVPKLAVAKHGDLLADKSNIGFAEHRFDVLSVTQAPRPKLFHQHYFDLRAFALHGFHIFRYLLGRFFAHMLSPFYFIPYTFYHSG